MSKVDLEKKIRDLKGRLVVLRDDQFAKIDLKKEKELTLEKLKVGGVTYKKRTAEIDSLELEIQAAKNERAEIKTELTPLVKEFEKVHEPKAKRTSVKSFAEAKNHFAVNSADEYSLDIEGFEINANYGGFYALKNALIAEKAKSNLTDDQIRKFKSAGDHWRYEILSPKEVLLKETFKQLRFLFERKKNTEWSVSSTTAQLELDAGDFGILVHPKRMRSLRQSGMADGKYRFSLIDELIEFDSKTFNDIVQSILYLASQSYRNEAISTRRKYQQDK